MRDALGWVYGSSGPARGRGPDGHRRPRARPGGERRRGGRPAGRARAEALNTALPDDVAVVTAEEAAPDFHARHSARARSYRYRIWRRRTPSPFEQHRSWWYPYPSICRALADTADLLRRQARLPGFHQDRDGARGLHPHDSQRGLVERGDALELEITADSFLRHMVRTLVGTMLERTPERIRAATRGPPARPRRARQRPVAASTWSAFSTTSKRYESSGRLTEEAVPRVRFVQRSPILRTVQVKPLRRVGVGLVAKMNASPSRLNDSSLLAHNDACTPVGSASGSPRPSRRPQLLGIGREAATVEPPFTDVVSVGWPIVRRRARRRTRSFRKRAVEEQGGVLRRRLRRRGNGKDSCDRGDERPFPPHDPSEELASITTMATTDLASRPRSSASSSSPTSTGTTCSTTRRSPTPSTTGSTTSSGPSRRRTRS